MSKLQSVFVQTAKCICKSGQIFQSHGRQGSASEGVGGKRAWPVWTSAARHCLRDHRPVPTKALAHPHLGKSWKYRNTKMQLYITPVPMTAFGTIGQCQPKPGKRHIARILEFEEYKNSFDRIISQWQPVQPLKVKKARYKKVQLLKMWILNNVPCR